MLRDVQSQFVTTIIFSLLLFSSLRAAAFLLEIEPWETDRPAPDDILFYNIVIEPGDPRTVDIILYNGDLNNFTIIFENDRLKGDDDATGFNIPFVPPGTRYTGRLGRPNTDGAEVLAESRPFEIFPAGTKPSSATVSSSRSSSSTTSPGASSSPSSISVATMTKILTLPPSPSPTQTLPSRALSFRANNTVVATGFLLLAILLM